MNNETKKENVRCSNCNNILLVPEEIGIEMCDFCLTLLSKLSERINGKFHIQCHVCKIKRNIIDYWSILSVEDCICNHCNQGYDFNKK